MTKKTIIVSALVLTVAGSGLFAVSQASAQNATTNTTLVQRIAEKFNLKHEDVQAVFDQHRSEKHAQMQARFEEKLTQLVTDGKITETQKGAIIAKMKELHAKKEANMENLKDMTPEERKAAMQSERKALEDWAEQNSIDLSILRGIGPMHGMKVRGGFGMGDTKDVPAAIPAQ